MDSYSVPMDKKIKEYIDKNPLEDFYKRNKGILELGGEIEELYPPLYIGNRDSSAYELPSPQLSFFYIYSKEEREMTLRSTYEDFISSLGKWEVSLHPYWYKKDES